MVDKINQTRVLLPDGSTALAPDDQVMEGIRQGNWRLPEFDNDGQPMQIPLRDKDGVFNVQSADLNKNVEDAILGGVTLGSMDDFRAEAAKRKKEIIKENYDGAFTAGTLGAFRGATLGLTDVALEKMGYADAIKGIKETNPNASLVGDITGTVGSVLLSGGAGLAGKIASKTGAALTSKAGTAVGKKAVEKLATKYGIKDGVKKRALELGIGSAVEGALYSGGRTLVDETLLGDEKANYGKIFQDTLTGGLFSGAVGGSLPVLGQALKSGVTRLSDFVESPKLWNGVRKTYAQAMKLKGGDPKLVEELFDVNKVDQKRLAKYMERLTSADDDIAAEVNNFMMSADEQLKHSAAIRNRGFANEYLDNPISGFDDATSGMVEIENKIVDAINKAETSPNVYEVGSVRKFKELQGVIDDFMGAENLRDYAKSMYKTRMQADSLLNRYRALSKLPEGLDETQKATRDLLQDIRSAADAKVKSYDMFGPAGEEFKLADRLYANIITPYQTLKGFGKMDTFKKIGGEMADNELELATKVDREIGFNPKLIAKVLRNPNVSAKKSSIRNAINAIEDQFKAAGKAIEEFQPNQTAVKSIDKINKLVSLARGVKSLEKQTGRNLAPMLLTGSLGGTVGAAVAGPMGAVAGQAAGMAAGQLLANPVTVSKVLMNMESSVKNFNKGVRTYFKSLEIPKRDISPIKTGISSVIYQISQQKETKSNKELIRSINEGTLFERLNKRVEAISQFAPKHAAVMQSQLDLAKGLISQIVPPGVLSETVKGESLLELDRSQERKINNILVATLAPKEFLGMLQNNQVGPEMMSAFKQAHTQLFMELQENALNSIINKKLPRQSELRLQYLFDLPVTQSTANIASTQRLLYPQDEQTSQGQMQPKKAQGLRMPGLDEVEFSKRQGSVSQQFA